MEIISDLRILKALENRSDGEWKFNKKFKYEIGPTYKKINKITYKNDTYILKYFDGCLYPFCVKQ